MPITINLTGHELEQCDLIAQQRNKKNDGVIDRRITTKKSSYDINFLGLLGEFAVAKYLGFGVNVDYNPNGGDGGTDFVYQNKKFDVKYNDNTMNPILMFPTLSKFKSDFAILTSPVKKHCRHELFLWGWTDKKHFEKSCYPDDFGYGNTWCLNHENLFNMELLKV